MGLLVMREIGKDECKSSKQLESQEREQCMDVFK